MKNKKFGVLVDGALATAVLAAAMSATTWARPRPVLGFASCCATATCTVNGVPVKIEDCTGGCASNERCGSKPGSASCDPPGIKAECQAI